MKKRLFMSISFATLLLAIASNGYAQDDNVKICSFFGSGFHYMPGFNPPICINDLNGDTRQITSVPVTEPALIWRAILPYPQGTWVPKASLATACLPDGKLMKVGDFKSSDFTINDWGKKQTFAVPFPIKPPQFISKVIMSGGFYNPRLPQIGRNGSSLGGGAGLCLRYQDPDLLESDGTTNVPRLLGNLLPIACIGPGRFIGMPGAYVVPAQFTYPVIDTYFTDANQTVIAGPYVFGDELLVTTDLVQTPLQYHDPIDPIGTDRPLAGTLSVSVCVNNN